MSTFLFTIAGLMIGFIFGFFLASILYAGSESDKQIEQMTTDKPLAPKTDKHGYEY